LEQFNPRPPPSQNNTEELKNSKPEVLTAVNMKIRVF
jgi:hypothetical protein